MPKFTIEEHGPECYGLYQDGKRIAVISDCEEETAKEMTRKLNGEIDIDAVNAALDTTPFHIGRGSWQTLSGQWEPTIWAGPRDGEAFRDFSLVEDGDEVFSAFLALASAMHRRDEGQADYKQQRDELLEALKDVWEQNICGCGHPACRDCKLDLIASTAIAKAEGGQP